MKPAISLRTASIVLACVLVPSALYAADVVVPHQFTAGTRVVAGEVNANFTALRNGVNRRFELPVGRSAFTWAGGSSAGPTPQADYSYSSSGGAITQSNPAPGEYNVRFAGMAPTTTNGGHVQISTYAPAGTFRHCVIVRWGPDAVPNATDVHVQCYNIAGNLADSRFTLLLVY